MAALVRGWTSDRPSALRGVIWYRLPVPGDALNWRWPTLARAMRGEAPAADVRAVAERPAPELVEVRVENRGDADASVRDVEVAWRDARCVAADGYGGFEVERAGAGRARMRARPGTALERLPPGASRPVGWLRLDRAAEVEVHAAR
jgi:hypothetical protein